MLQGLQACFKSEVTHLHTYPDCLRIGAGQTSRVMSTRIALWQAEEARLPIEGAVMASDAFIPFSDSIEFAHKKGVVAIIQPGGSIRDEQMIHVANEMGLVMVFTGVRHLIH